MERKFAENYIFPKINLKLTGEKIRSKCTEKNISVREIQQKMGVSSSQSVYNWFHGRTLPTLDNFVALSYLIETPMDELIVCEYESNTKSRKSET